MKKLWYGAVVLSRNITIHGSGLKTAVEVAVLPFVIAGPKNREKCLRESVTQRPDSHRESDGWIGFSLSLIEVEEEKAAQLANRVLEE